MKHNKNKKNAEDERVTMLEHYTPGYSDGGYERPTGASLAEIKQYQRNLMKDYADTVFETMIPKMIENGYKVENGHIVEIGNPGYSGFIPSMALDVDDNGNVDLIPTTVVCSVNKGFRYASPDMMSESPNDTYDNGPLSMPTIVGNAERPTALLVPLGEPDAILDGIDFLDSFFKRSMCPPEENYHNEIGPADYEDNSCQKIKDRKW